MTLYSRRADSPLPTQRSLASDRGSNPAPRPSTKTIAMVRLPIPPRWLGRNSTSSTFGERNRLKIASHQLFRIRNIFPFRTFRLGCRGNGNGRPLADFRLSGYHPVRDCTFSPCATKRSAVATDRQPGNSSHSAAIFWLPSGRTFSFMLEPRWVASSISHSWSVPPVPLAI